MVWVGIEKYEQNYHFFIGWIGKENWASLNPSIFSQVKQGQN